MLRTAKRQCDGVDGDKEKPYDYQGGQTKYRRYGPPRCQVPFSSFHNANIDHKGAIFCAAWNDNAGSSQDMLNGMIPAQYYRGDGRSDIETVIC